MIIKLLVKAKTIIGLSVLAAIGCQQPAQNKIPEQERISISGIQLGMDQQSAISVMESRGIFKWTSFDGTIVVGTERNCGGQVIYKSREKHIPCTHTRLDSVKLSPNSQSRDWIVAEISYEQVFEDNIHIDVWKERIEEMVGSLVKSDDHYAAPINVHFGEFIGIVKGRQARLQALVDGSRFFYELEEELMKDGCREPLQFVEATAYHRASMVFAYKLKLIDLQLKCQEKRVREQSTIAESKKFIDQMDFN